MDHLAGRLAAALVSSADDPAPAPASVPAAGGDGNLLDVIRAIERAEGTIRDQVTHPSPPPPTAAAASRWRPATNPSRPHRDSPPALGGARHMGELAAAVALDAGDTCSISLPSGCRSWTPKVHLLLPFPSSQDYSLLMCRLVLLTEDKFANIITD
jgi:hypothetical protein